MRRGALVIGLVLIVVALASSAAADPLADRQAEASRVERQLAGMDVRLERLAEALDAARQHVEDTDRAIATNEGELQRTQVALAQAQRALGLQLGLRYRVGSADPTLVLLAATSVGDLIDRVDVLRRTSGQAAAVVDRVLVVKTAIDELSVSLAARRVARAATAARLDAARSGLTAGIAGRTRYLSSVRAAIRTIIAQRAAAAAEAARHERSRILEVRRLAAARQGVADAERRRKHRPPPPPPPSDPGIGGSAGGSTGGSPGVPTVPSPHAGSRAADIALTQLGVSYVWAGSSPQEGFDCSGLTMWAYARVGITLPHNAAEQHGMGTPVARDALAPGDLVFFDGDAHVGIYVGGGQVVHAPHTGAVVRISSLDAFGSYAGAVRIV